MNLKTHITNRCVEKHWIKKTNNAKTKTINNGATVTQINVRQAIKVSIIQSLNYLN